ncbi:helix-hairpin-helix domain-containing protein [Kozakia baliensis]
MTAHRNHFPYLLCLGGAIERNSSQMITPALTVSNYRRQRVRRRARIGIKVQDLTTACANPAPLAHNRMPLYDSIEDVWRRADVPVSSLERLAEADAFRSLDLDRRAALWAIKGLAPSVLPLFAAAERFANRIESEFNEPSFPLAPMSEGADVVEDYVSGCEMGWLPSSPNGIAVCQRGGW